MIKFDEYLKCNFDQWFQIYTNIYRILCGLVRYHQLYKVNVSDLQCTPGGFFIRCSYVHFKPSACLQLYSLLCITLLFWSWVSKLYTRIIRNNIRKHTCYICERMQLATSLINVIKNYLCLITKFVRSRKEKK